MKTPLTPLKKVRILKNLGQMELEQLAGLPYGYVTLFERNLRNPEKTQVEKLAKALGVSPKTIFPGVK